MKIISSLVVIVVLFCGDFCEASSFYRNRVCKENLQEVCKEYDDFVDYLFGNRNWDIPLDFFSVPLYEVREDGSKHDPLSDEFYK